MIINETKFGTEISIKSPKVSNSKRNITFYNRIIEMYKNEYEKYNDDDYREYVMEAMNMAKRKLSNIKSKLSK